MPRHGQVSPRAAGAGGADGAGSPARVLLPMGGDLLGGREAGPDGRDGALWLRRLRSMRGRRPGRRRELAEIKRLKRENAELRRAKRS